MEYDKCTAARDIANSIIPDFHEHLAGIKIAYLLKLTEDEKPIKLPSRSGKKLVFGSAAKIADKLHFLSGYVFVIEFDEKLWKSLSDRQQMALVDHELCHCGYDDDGPYIKDHDLTEFRAVIARHGMWTDDVKRFVQVATGQDLPLFRAPLINPGEDAYLHTPKDAVIIPKGMNVRVGDQTWTFDGHALIMVSADDVGDPFITRQQNVSNDQSDLSGLAQQLMGTIGDQPVHLEISCALPGCKGHLQRYDVMPEDHRHTEALKGWTEYPVWVCLSCDNIHAKSLVEQLMGDGGPVK